MEKKLKVLLVDDDPDLLHILKLSMETSQQFRVVTAKNGQDACFKFRNEDFDAVVTDLKMPKMDGIEFVTSIRKIKMVPIFIISASLEAYKFKIKDQKLASLKNVSFLPKPFNPDELIKMVKAIHVPREAVNATVAKSNDEVLFKRGDIIFSEGAKNQSVFLLKEGTIKIFKKTQYGFNIEVGSIGAGELSGNLTENADGVSTVTLIAETDGKYLKISSEKILETMSSQPAWFKILMKTVNQRLLNTYEALAETKAINEKEKKLTGS